MRLDYKTSKVLLSSNILLSLYKRTEIVIIYITKRNVILEYNLPQNPKTGNNLKGISFEQLYNSSNG